MPGAGHLFWILRDLFSSLCKKPLKWCFPACGPADQNLPPRRPTPECNGTRHTPAGTGNLLWRQNEAYRCFTLSTYTNSFPLYPSRSSWLPEQKGNVVLGEFAIPSDSDQLFFGDVALNNSPGTQGNAWPNLPSGIDRGMDTCMNAVAKDSAEFAAAGIDQDTVHA